jgi:hypothetical protein
MEIDEREKESRGREQEEGRRREKLEQKSKGNSG